METLSANTYYRVLNAANQHVLRSLSAGADGEDRDETICKLAEREFDAKRRRAALEDAVTGLPYDRHEQILAAAWGLVSAHMDAAFTFGSVAAVQAAHPLNVRVSARQARRGGRGARKASRQ